MNEKPSTKHAFLYTNLILLTMQIILNFSLIFQLTEMIPSLIIIILKILLDITILLLFCSMKNKITHNLIMNIILINRIL